MLQGTQSVNTCIYNLRLVVSEPCYSQFGMAGLLLILRPTCLVEMKKYVVPETEVLSIETNHTMLVSSMTVGPGQGDGGNRHDDWWW